MVIFLYNYTLLFEYHIWLADTVESWRRVEKKSWKREKKSWKEVVLYSKIPQ